MSTANISYSLQLECPSLGEFEGKLSKAIVRVPESSVDKEKGIAELIWKQKKTDEQLYLFVINDFDESIEYSQRMEQVTENKENLKHIRVRSLDELARMLKDWNAESHVCVWIHEQTAKLRIANLESPKPRPFLQRLFDFGFERPFIESFCPYIPVTFYSQSHCSIEIWGSKQHILNIACEISRMEFPGT